MHRMDAIATPVESLTHEPTSMYLPAGQTYTGSELTLDVSTQSWDATKDSHHRNCIRARNQMQLTESTSASI